MSSDPTRSNPSPERLAAYLDGQLDAADAARVAAWLADHPAAAEEMEGQRRLLRVWQANPPPEPGPAAWAVSLGRIQSRLPAAAPRPWRLPRPLWLAAGAAAVFAAVLLARSFQGEVPPKGGEEQLPVIGPGDVTVISIDARDAAGLVVAAPPVQEPILLASQEDVSVMDVKAYRDDDGRVPQIGEGEVPMIVAASVAGAAREPQLFGSRPQRRRAPR